MLNLHNNLFFDKFFDIKNEFMSLSIKDLI